MSYIPHDEKYLHSGIPTEKTDDAFIWVANELYQFLLMNPLITKTIYETRDGEAYLSLVERIVKDTPHRRFDRDFYYDWSICGENNGFMNILRSAYQQIPQK